MTGQPHEHRAVRLPASGREVVPSVRLPLPARAAHTTAALVLLAVGLTGCTAGRPSRPAVPARSAVAADAETLGSAGSYDVLVRRVDSTRATMTVDTVQYLTGDAAARACAEDGVPDQHGPLCHDFYIRDRSNRLWTVPLGPGVVISVHTAGCGPARPVGLGGLTTELAVHRLFRLDIAGGSVTRLTERCEP